MNSTNKEGVLISYNQTNKKVEKYEIKNMTIINPSVICQ